MAMKRCPECGEKYSDTYQYCPFCEEEEAFRDGEEIRRASRGGKRAAPGGKIDLLTPTLVVLILVMAALLVYLLYGDKIADKLHGKEEPVTPPAEEVVKPEQPTIGDEPDVPEEPGDITMPEDPSVPSEPDAPNGGMTYETAAKLPSGLTLSTTDFTLKKLGETNSITVSGGSGSYTWFSQDDGIVSVDSKGKVTAVSNGTVNVLVTDGTKQATCIVRVSASGTQPVTPPSGGSTGSGLQKGAATVINGGNGVRVRSGPSTNHEILATVPNGADVEVVESADDGWYKITFSGMGGVTTPGYMKGEFLQNK